MIIFNGLQNGKIMSAKDIYDEIDLKSLLEPGEQEKGCAWRHSLFILDGSGVQTNVTAVNF